MLRYALRSLGRSPVFAIVTVVSLGLALALNTTLFALVDAVVHPEVPYVHPERVFSAITFGGDRRRPIDGAEVARAVRDGVGVAQEVAAWNAEITMLRAGSIMEDGVAAGVSNNFFSLLGVRPLVGRDFDSTSAASDGRQQAIISYRLWQRFYHGRSLSERLRIAVGSGIFDVVGVMPRGTHFPFGDDVWVPLASSTVVTPGKPAGSAMIFRLKPGATRDEARHQIEGAMAQLAAAYGQSVPYAVALSSLEPGVGDGTPYRYMLDIVALVLIIACANLGTMMLARGMARRRELAIRMAVGASRRAIVRQVLTECGVIVIAGLIVGCVLMLWALHLVPHVLAPYVPALGDMRANPSWRVFAFAAIVAVATTFIAGSLPAFRAAGVDPAEPIKAGGTSSERIRDRYNPLIIVEVALSTGLLMSAGLFVLYSMRLAAFQFQYDASWLVVASLSAGRMHDSSTAVQFYDGIMERALRLPHVLRAATSTPDKPDRGVIFAEDGLNGNHWMNSSGYLVVSPGYLATIGIPVVDGRDFAAGDRGSGTGVAIVDQAAARRLWPGRTSPIGRMLKLGDEKSHAPWLRVVGVARSTEFEPRRDLELPPEPKIFVMLGHDNGRTRQLVVRGDGVGGLPGRAALALSLRHELQDVAPWMGSPRVTPWLQQYDDRRSYSAFVGTTLATFGMFGLVLCAVGLYGVLSYSVSRRLREFAIRTALGARAGDVVRIVVHDTTVTVLAGIGIGAFLGLAFTYRMADSLFTVHYEFVLVLIAAEVLLVAAAIVACLGPIGQAIHADPVEILRSN